MTIDQRMTKLQCDLSGQWAKVRSSGLGHWSLGFPWSLAHWPLVINNGTFYAMNGSGMKTSSPNSSADCLIQYLHTHSSILTDQGINVGAFIDRLSAFKGNSGPSERAPRALKPKSSKKIKG